MAKLDAPMSQCRHRRSHSCLTDQGWRRWRRPSLFDPNDQVHLCVFILREKSPLYDESHWYELPSSLFRYSGFIPDCLTGTNKASWRGAAERWREEANNQIAVNILKCQKALCIVVNFQEAGDIGSGEESHREWSQRPDKSLPFIIWSQSPISQQHSRAPRLHNSASALGVRLVFEARRLLTEQAKFVYVLQSRCSWLLKSLDSCSFWCLSENLVLSSMGKNITHLMNTRNHP